MWWNPFNDTLRHLCRCLDGEKNILVCTYMYGASAFRQKPKYKNSMTCKQNTTIVYFNTSKYIGHKEKHYMYRLLMWLRVCSHTSFYCHLTSMICSAFYVFFKEKLSAVYAIWGVIYNGVSNSLS